MLIFFVLLHKGDEAVEIGAFALRFTVMMEHELGELLQGFLRTTEFGNAQIQFSNQTVHHSIAVK